MVNLKITFALVGILVLGFSEVLSQVPTCPPPDPENPQTVFFPDPSDCTAYYMCENGIPIRLLCPPPTVWDPTIVACNYPGIYHCEPTTTSTEPPTTTAQASSTAAPASTTAAPASTTAAPASTTAAPASTTAAPASTEVPASSPAGQHLVKP